MLQYFIEKTGVKTMVKKCKCQSNGGKLKKDGDNQWLSAP